DALGVGESGQDLAATLVLHDLGLEMNLLDAKQPIVDCGHVLRALSATVGSHSRRSRRIACSLALASISIHGTRANADGITAISSLCRRSLKPSRPFEIWHNCQVGSGQVVAAAA